MRRSGWSPSKVAQPLIATFSAEAIYVRDDGIACWPLRLTTGFAILVGGRDDAARLDFHTPIGIAIDSSDAADAELEDASRRGPARFEFRERNELWPSWEVEIGWLSADELATLIRSTLDQIHEEMQPLIPATGRRSGRITSGRFAAHIGDSSRG